MLCLITKLHVRFEFSLKIHSFISISATLSFKNCSLLSHPCAPILCFNPLFLCTGKYSDIFKYFFHLIIIIRVVWIFYKRQNWDLGTLLNLKHTSSTYITRTKNQVSFLSHLLNYHASTLYNSVEVWNLYYFINVFKE